MELGTAGSTAVVEKSSRVSLGLSAVSIEEVQAAACTFWAVKNTQVAAACMSTEAVHRSTVSFMRGREGGEWGSSEQGEWRKGSKLTLKPWNFGFEPIPCGCQSNYLMLCLCAELASPNFWPHEMIFQQSWNSAAVHRFLRSLCWDTFCEQ